jgi:ATP-dependent DNA helicase RecQ
VLRQGTPFFAGYRLRPLGAESFEEIFSRFDVARAGFLRRLIETGKTGRTWTTLAPDAAAAALGELRGRIAALEYLAQQGLVDLQPAELRQRYTVLARPDADDTLVERLLERFARREHAETGRIEDVLELVTHDGRQVRALTRYFGESRADHCGHCSHCLLGSAQRPPPSEPGPPIETSFDAEAFKAVRGEHPDALGWPRQQARFLCGITSPATTRAKLAKHSLFGSLAERRFGEVLAWCETLRQPAR